MFSIFVDATSYDAGISVLRIRSGAMGKSLRFPKNIGEVPREILDSNTVFHLINQVVLQIRMMNDF